LLCIFSKGAFVSQKISFKVSTKFDWPKKNERVSKPSHPSDILWENLDMKKGEWFLRRLVTLFLGLLATVIPIGFITVLSLFQSVNFLLFCFHTIYLDKY